MTSQPFNYKIVGENLQVLEVSLNPGETILAEAGALICMDEGIAHETCLGDGSEPNQVILGKIFPPTTRLLSGETLFYTYFTNYGRGMGKILLSTPYLGAPHKVKLSDFNNELIFQRGTFLCAPKGVKLSSYNFRKSVAGTKADPISLNRIQGEGDVIVNVGGSLIERTLAGEAIHIDASCIVAYDSQIDFSIESVGDVKTMMLGNDAFVMGTLRGSGRVLLQSAPLRKTILSLNTFIRHMHLSTSMALGKLYDE
jgi:Uncharacterized conserved protein